MLAEEARSQCLARGIGLMDSFRRPHQVAKEPLSTTTAACFHRYSFKYSATDVHVYDATGEKQNTGEVWTREKRRASYIKTQFDKWSVIWKSEVIDGLSMFCCRVGVLRHTPSSGNATSG